VGCENDSSLPHTNVNVLVRLDHDAFLSAKRLQEILMTFLAIRRFRPSTRTMAAIHGKCAPHAGQILVSLVISFPQWQMNVPFAMRLPTMKVECQRLHRLQSSKVAGRLLAGQRPM
jgi:hypothetical protein